MKKLSICAILVAGFPQIAQAQAQNWDGEWRGRLACDTSVSGSRPAYNVGLSIFVNGTAAEVSRAETSSHWTGRIKGQVRLDGSATLQGSVLSPTMTSNWPARIDGRFTETGFEGVGSEAEGFNRQRCTVKLEPSSRVLAQKLDQALARTPAVAQARTAPSTPPATLPSGRGHDGLWAGTITCGPQRSGQGSGYADYIHVEVKDGSLATIVRSVGRTREHRALIQPSGKAAFVGRTHNAVSGSMPSQFAGTFTADKFSADGYEGEGEQLRECQMELSAIDPAVGSLAHALKNSAAAPQAAAQETVRQQGDARQEATRQQAARQEAARQEAARQAAARQEAARQEAARQEAARQEAARQEAARQEAARQEAARQEAARQEAARQEAARQEDERRKAEEARAAELAAAYDRAVVAIPLLSGLTDADYLVTAPRRQAPNLRYRLDGTATIPSGRAIVCVASSNQPTFPTRIAEWATGELRSRFRLSELTFACPANSPPDLVVSSGSSLRALNADGLARLSDMALGVTVLKFDEFEESERQKRLAEERRIAAEAAERARIAAELERERQRIAQLRVDNLAAVEASTIGDAFFLLKTNNNGAEICAVQHSLVATDIVQTFLSAISRQPEYLRTDPELANSSISTLKNAEAAFAALQEPNRCRLIFGVPKDIGPLIGPTKAILSKQVSASHIIISKNDIDAAVGEIRKQAAERAAEEQRQREVAARAAEERRQRDTAERAEADARRRREAEELQRREADQKAAADRAAALAREQRGQTIAKIAGTYELVTEGAGSKTFLMRVRIEPDGQILDEIEDRHKRARPKWQENEVKINGSKFSWSRAHSRNVETFRDPFRSTIDGVIMEVSHPERTGADICIAVRQEGVSRNSNSFLNMLHEYCFSHARNSIELKALITPFFSRSGVQAGWGRCASGKSFSIDGFCEGQWDDEPETPTIWTGTRIERSHADTGEGRATHIASTGLAPPPSPDQKAVDRSPVGALVTAVQEPPKRTPPRETYPYTAVLTCGFGQHINIVACFAGRDRLRTEIHLNTEGEGRVITAHTLHTIGTESFEGFRIDLAERFSLRAQNASKSLILGLKIIDKLSGEVIFKQDAGQFGVVSFRR